MTKSLVNWKTATDAGPERPFRYLDTAIEPVNTFMYKQFWSVWKAVVQNVKIPQIAPDFATVPVSDILSKSPSSM